MSRLPVAVLVGVLVALLVFAIISLLPAKAEARYRHRACGHGKILLVHEGACVSRAQARRILDDDEPRVIVRQVVREAPAKASHDKACQAPVRAFEPLPLGWPERWLGAGLLPPSRWQL